MGRGGWIIVGASAGIVASKDLTGKRRGRGGDVGAVSVWPVAGPLEVAAHPALVGLVVFHRGDHMVINSSGHFEIGVRMSVVHYFARPRLDISVDRHQPVRL